MRLSSWQQKLTVGGGRRHAGERCVICSLFGAVLQKNMLNTTARKQLK